jgi:hypothetical protein
LVSTLRPGGDNCVGTANGDLLVFDPSSGGRTSQATFDVNGDGVVNSSDAVTVGGSGVVASGFSFSGGFAQPPTFIQGGAAASQAQSGTGPTDKSYDGAGTAGGATVVSGRGVPYGGVGRMNQGVYLGVANKSSGSFDNRSYQFGRAAGRIAWRELVSD